MVEQLTERRGLRKSEPNRTKESAMEKTFDALLGAFRQGSLIVDVSCDEGMGFSWATPTTFDEPMFTVADRVHYYAVDHSPSYLWNSATWENSNALIPFLRPVLEGPAAWDAEETLSRAIEIRDGLIVNPAILTFQGRSAEPPHLIQ